MRYDIGPEMIRPDNQSLRTSLELVIIQDVLVNISSSVFIDKVLGVEGRDHGIVIKREHEDGEGRDVSVINDGRIFQRLIKGRSEENVLIYQSPNAVFGVKRSPYEISEIKITII
jgi:hypothetical protein